MFFFFTACRLFAMNVTMATLWTGEVGRFVWGVTTRLGRGRIRFPAVVVRIKMIDFLSQIPGGGGHSTFIWTGGGGAAGGRKPDPVANHLARKKYTLSQYTLLKLSYAYPVLVRTDSLFCKNYTLSQYTLLKLS